MAKKPIPRDEGRRLSPADWLEIEELYAQGMTQTALAARYGVRKETVSRHMTKAGVKGNEKAALVRKELEMANLKKKREFAEKKADREIQSKERLFTLQNALLGSWTAEFRKLVESKAPMAALAASAKSMREATAALKGIREEIYTILEINPDLGSEAPDDLEVHEFTAEEEQALRDQRGTSLDEDAEMLGDLDAEALRMLEEVDQELSSDDERDEGAE